MAYNKQNYLERIIELQEKFKLEYKAGVSIEWIYKNVIRQQFKISRSTFYKWVSYPAKKELNQLLSTQHKEGLNA